MRAPRCAKRSDMPEVRRIAGKDMGMGPLSLSGEAEACGVNCWTGPSISIEELGEDVIDGVEEDVKAKSGARRSLA